MLSESITGDGNNHWSGRHNAAQQDKRDENASTSSCLCFTAPEAPAEGSIFSNFAANRKRSTDAEITG
jgi:hypothetical protein